MSAFADKGLTPSDFFDLKNWKLQIPGPREIKDLKGYSSADFYLNDKNEICFELDASQKGTTAHTKYVRNELRHMKNWKITQDERINAELRAVSHLLPDKLTVLQIHGIGNEGEDIPPLLRVAINQGSLVAFVKTTDKGDKTGSYVLERNIGEDYFKISVAVKDCKLIISVNGMEKLNKDISYWKHLNYFKLGAYPQAQQGSVKIEVRQLSVAGH